MKKYYGIDTKSTYIEQMEAGGKGVPEAEKELGITENTLCNWKRKLRGAPKRGLPGGRSQKPDMKYPRKPGNENVRQKRYSEK